MVVGVGDVDAVLAVEGQAGGSVELAVAAAGLAPVEEVGAVGVVGGDAVELFVADEAAALAVDGGASGPDEEASVVSLPAEVAEVAAVGVADSDAEAAGGLLAAAADDVHAVVGADGGVDGVVEALALHDGHAHGAVVLQELSGLGHCASLFGGPFDAAQDRLLDAAQDGPQFRSP